MAFFERKSPEFAHKGFSVPFSNGMEDDQDAVGEAKSVRGISRADAFKLLSEAARMGADDSMLVGLHGILVPGLEFAGEEPVKKEQFFIKARAIEYLKVSRHLFDRLVAEGKIAPCETAAGCRYRKSDLDALKI